MGRIRSVKPELFKHGDLFDLEKATGLPIRLAWIGLFTAADREGRFKWRPRELQTDILPYDDPNTMHGVLEALERAGFVKCYEVDGDRFGYIPKWLLHQVIRPDEAKSKIPAPPDTDPSEPVTGSGEPDGNPPRGTGVGTGKGTGVGVAPEGAAPAAEVSPRGGPFGIAPELRGNSALEHALSYVPLPAQIDWLSQFTPASIKKTCLKAISTFQAESKTELIDKIPNLGPRLTAWVARERESLMKLPAPAKPREPAVPWPEQGGMLRALNGQRPLEALRRAQVAK
jgi:hypothetical protein